MLVYRLFAGGDLASQDQITKDIKANTAVLIDVREQDEIQSGMIKGANFIPLSLIKSHPDQAVVKIKALASDKKIYFYCRSGTRSGIAISSLKEHGINGVNAGGFSRLKEFFPTTN